MAHGGSKASKEVALFGLKKNTARFFLLFLLFYSVSVRRTGTFLGGVKETLLSRFYWLSSVFLATQLYVSQLPSTRQEVNKPDLQIEVTIGAMKSLV